MPEDFSSHLQVFANPGLPKGLENCLDPYYINIALYLLKMQKVSLDLFTLVAISFILLLASVNITTYLEPKKVLGVSVVEAHSDEAFWQDFLSKNPSYLPGWVAIGRMDKVKEIDPNYIKP